MNFNIVFKLQSLYLKQIKLFHHDFGTVSAFCEKDFKT